MPRRKAETPTPAAPRSETHEEWFQRVLAEARQHGLDENIFRLGFEAGKLLHPLSAADRKAGAESFLRLLDQLDSEAYSTLVKVATEQAGKSAEAGKPKNRPEQPPDWFEPMLAEIRRAGKEHFIPVAYALTDMLEPPAGTEKKSAVANFVLELDRVDPAGYFALAKLLNEYLLNNLLGLARRKELSELERAAELVLAEVSLLGIAAFCCELKTVTDSELRYRRACNYLDKLGQDDHWAAKDVADAGLIWLREEAKKYGVHGIVVAVQEITRLSQALYDTAGRLASPRPQ